MHIQAHRTMNGTELIILFKEDKAYLADGVPLPFDQLGLPPVAKSFKIPAYWIVRVLRHREEERKLFVSVTSYKIGDIPFPPQQIQMAGVLSDIKTITFKTIDTEGLLATLRGNEPAKIFIGETVAEYPVETTQENIVPAENAPAQPRLIVLDETFSVSMNDLRFRFGAVSFDHIFTKYQKKIELTIENYELREEFDAVKNYFANALNTKKINVVAHVEITDEAITLMRVRSAEIDRIDKKMIDSVRFEFVRDKTKKKLKAEIDKTLFTMDEYFESLTDKRLQSNAFYSSEDELFNDLISITQTKHYKHLRFLSSQHAYHIMKLRFVLKPFSFLFLLEGERHFHIVWETIDTREATYIWHVDKDLNMLKMALRKIEDILNVIKVQGKIAYLNANEDSFQRIRHDYSELIDGFIKWKGELENYLT